MEELLTAGIFLKKANDYHEESSGFSVFPLHKNPLPSTPSEYPGSLPRHWRA
jgi:hypothetical protein